LRVLAGEHTFNQMVDAPYLPALFAFPDPTQNIYFNISSFSFAPIPDAVWVVPAGCTRSCQGMLRGRHAAGRQGGSGALGFPIEP
jgi:hypothetical protein